MNKINKLCIFILLCLPLVAEAKVKCWTDKNNQRQCGDTIPPEYANSDVTRYNEKGNVERRTHQLTPEERRKKETDEQQQRNALTTNVESARRDSTLLNTFSNEQEIDLARDRNSQQIDARINSLNQLLKAAQTALASQRKQQDSFINRQQAVPPVLSNAIASGEEKIAKLQKQIAQSEQESAAINARFAADKARYRELKGLPPQ